MVTNALYGPTVWTVKLALSLLILHIFGRLRWIRLAIWFSILYTFVAYFSSMMIYVIPCVPRARGNLRTVSQFGSLLANRKKFRQRGGRDQRV